MIRTLTADRGDRGRRLDLVLRRRLTGIRGATRTRVQAWIEGGRVSVNGRAITRVAARVAPGDVVSVAVDDSGERGTPQPEAIALDVLYEDAHIIAVNKPAGLVAHPAYKHPGGTLLNALLWHARAWPEGERPALAGRLDRLTSGVVIAAKSRRVYPALHRALRAGEKVYLALVHGRVTLARGTIDLALGRDPLDRRRVIVSADARVRSVTHFETIASSRIADVSLLRCRLVTGRMHQIRVHLAARGWPIVGDPVYGLNTQMTDAVLRDFPRQALHAWQVAFTHPVTGAPLAVEAAVPSDIAELCAALALPYAAAITPRA